MNHHDRHAVPPLDGTTIDHMEKLFPARSPDPSDPEREVWMKAGEHRAVRHMRNLINKQERTHGAAFGGVRV